MWEYLVIKKIIATFAKLFNAHTRTMTLHVFNPEHDIALASGLSNFTAPHAGRQLRHDLGWLPAIWAEEGDIVLVDDEDTAAKGIARLNAAIAASERKKTANSQKSGRVSARFVTKADLRHLKPTSIDAWGWDAALRAKLLAAGIDEHLLPSEAQTGDIRELSHRREAAELLMQLTQGQSSMTEGADRCLLTGEAAECRSEEEVAALLDRWSKVVIKAPWSSSGRGIRFVNAQIFPRTSQLEPCTSNLVPRTSSDSPLASISGWLRNVLKAQGSVMVEPYYNKVCDFAMEFSSDGCGHIAYEGLSLFDTANGAYTGNLLATERRKREEISHYLPLTLLDETCIRICSLLKETIGRRYKGPFGIDMMVVGSETGEGGFLLHPAVEINLRRTMGHVALKLTPYVNPEEDDERVSVMRIAYEGGQYKQKIEKKPIAQ